MVPAADVVEKVALPCPFLPDPQTVPSRETQSWMEPSIELDLLRLLYCQPRSPIKATTALLITNNVNYCPSTGFWRVVVLPLGPAIQVFQDEGIVTAA